MDLERHQADRPPELPLSAKIAIGAMALLVAFTAVQWVVSGALRFIRFGLVVVVVVAVFGWVVSAKANR